MRISTSQIYDAGSVNIQRNQSALYKLQNQLSTGRRVNTPEDDPVAAAQALLVTQSRDVNAQHLENQGNASSQLGLVDSQLDSLMNVLQNVRERVIQAGNPVLSASNRASIATELESRLGEMLGIANSQNGSGDFLFSGYQGATLPFSIDGSGDFAYSGDDGERLLQVSSSRQMAVSVAGSDVFMNARSGNGTFVATTGGNVGVSGNVGNTGGATATGSVVNRQVWEDALNSASAQPREVIFSGAPGALTYQISDSAGVLTPLPPLPGISYTPGAPGVAVAIPLTTAAGVSVGAQLMVTGTPAVGDKFGINPTPNQGTAIADTGSVLDPQSWAAAVNASPAVLPLEIRFSPVAGVMNYEVVDATGLTTGLSPYKSGQAIKLLPGNLAQVVINGEPKAGDTFTIKPSTNQSLFQTMQSLIGTLRAPLGSTSYTSTEYTNALGAQLSNLDQAFDNVGRVQATVGTRMRELDALTDTSSDLNIQYQQNLSKLQDLDFAKAISEFTQQQVQLEAAQKSFVQISGLSLFNFI